MPVQYPTPSTVRFVALSTVIINGGVVKAAIMREDTAVPNSKACIQTSVPVGQVRSRIAILRLANRAALN